MRLHRLMVLFFFAPILGYWSVAGVNPDYSYTKLDGEMRTWTAKDGRTLEARAILVEGFSINLRRFDGKTLWVDLNKLSAEDLEYIKSLIPPPPFAFYVRTSLDVDRDRTWSADWGSKIYDESKQQEIEIEISNRGDVDYPFMAIAWILVKGPKEPQVRWATIIVDQKIPAGGRVETRYKSSKVEGTKGVFVALKTKEQWGDEFAGWAVTLHNKTGEVIDAAGSTPPRVDLVKDFWAKNAEQILADARGQ